MPNLTLVGSTKSTTAWNEELTKLMGYNGSIQATPLETTLDEHRMSLFEARSIIDSVAHAIEREFGQDCPADRPEFPRALRIASRMLDNVAGGLEAGTLEDRALEIARASAAKEGVNDG
jgi:hypothetical protein